MELELGEDFCRLLKDKRVVIIGPAPHLLKKNLGELFDTYDVVCRVNDIIPPPDIQQDYGTRTDIMFHNCGTPWMSGLRRKIDTASEAFKNLRMVVCPVIKSDHSENNYLSWGDDYTSNVVSNFESINQHGCPFYWIGVKNYKEIYSKIKIEFTAGLAAIILLLHSPLKELLVTGFTFYAEGSTHDDLYYEGHWDEEEKRGRSFGLNAGHGTHANTVQIQWFKKLATQYSDRLVVDSHLNKLLELNHKNIISL